MAVSRATLLGIALVGVPWAIILVDALLLGFHFGLSLAMLLVFAMGLVFLAALDPGA